MGKAGTGIKIICRLLAGGLLSCLLAWQTGQVSAQSIGQPGISSPGAGDALQGMVAVTGSTDIVGFVSAEIAFAYSAQPDATWFPLAVSEFPVSGGLLYTWDTSLITDGNYDLRLRIFLADGTVRDFLSAGLRIRNYTAVETATRQPSAAAPPPLPTASPTATLRPTPTSLPANPASLRPEGILAAGVVGALLGAAFLAALILLQDHRKY